MTNYKQLKKDIKKLKYKQQCKDFCLTCYQCVANASIDVVLLEIDLEIHSQKQIEKMKKSKGAKEYKKMIKEILK